MSFRANSDRYSFQNTSRCHGRGLGWVLVEMFCLGLKFPDYNPGAIVCCQPSGVGERSLEGEGREGGGGAGWVLLPPSFPISLFIELGRRVIYNGSSDQSVTALGNVGNKGDAYRISSFLVCGFCPIRGQLQRVWCENLVSLCRLNARKSVRASWILL